VPLNTAVSITIRFYFVNENIYLDTAHQAIGFSRLNSCCKYLGLWPEYPIVDDSDLHMVSAFGPATDYLQRVIGETRSKSQNSREEPFKFSRSSGWRIYCCKITQKNASFSDLMTYQLDGIAHALDRQDVIAISENQPISTCSHSSCSGEIPPLVRSKRVFSRNLCLSFVPQLRSKKTLYILNVHYYQ